MGRPKGNHQHTKPAQVAHGRRTLILGAAALLVAITIVAIRRNSQPSPTEPVAKSPAAAAPVVTNPISPAQLVGRWHRPDGGYIIEIRDATADGKLNAAYFNPQPINVSRAEWKRDGAALDVFVELRDANYPGATYKLRYVPQADILVGEYFQPAYQQTYQIQFERLPK